MKSSIFQRPPKIACSTSWSKTVEPPTMRVRAGDGADPADDLPRRRRLGLRVDARVDEPVHAVGCSAPAATTETTPGTAASRRASAAGAATSTTWTGELKPGPASAAARSVATRTSAFAGSSFEPAVERRHPEQRRGEHEHRRGAAGERATGRRITRSAQRSQKASPPSSPVRQGSGRRNRSTRVPATASSAGSSVVDGEDGDGDDDDRADRERADPVHGDREQAGERDRHRRAAEDDGGARAREGPRERRVARRRPRAARAGSG